MTVKQALRQAACKLLTILTSRKFIAFSVATWLLYDGHLNSYAYAAITLAFIGAQGYLDNKQMTQTFLRRSAPRQGLLTPPVLPGPTLNDRTPLSLDEPLL